MVEITVKAADSASAMEEIEKRLGADARGLTLLEKPGLGTTARPLRSGAQWHPWA